MTQNPIEAIGWRIYELEVFIDMMRAVPKEGAEVEVFIPILEERVVLLKQAYTRLWEMPDGSADKP